MLPLLLEVDVQSLWAITSPINVGLLIIAMSSAYGGLKYIAVANNPSNRIITIIIIALNLASQFT